MPNNSKEERYKNFYTVKEAAKLLGVSTNTIYTHLNKGSLTGQRLNSRGRFKIPFEQLQPFLKVKVVEESVAPVFTAPVKVSTSTKLTGLEILLGAAAGLLLVYSFWNVDFNSWGTSNANTANSVFLKETTDAILSYSNRSFSKYGSITQNVAINVDKNIFKGSLIAKNASEDNKVLGADDSGSNSQKADVNQFLVFLTNYFSNPNNLTTIFVLIVGALVGGILGFIFFLIIKSFSKNKVSGKLTENKTFDTKVPVNVSNNIVVNSVPPKSNKINAISLAIIFFLALGSTTTLALGSAEIYNLETNKEKPSGKVLAQQSIDTSITNANATTITTTDKSVENIEENFSSILIKVPAGTRINIREEASSSSKIVSKIISDQEAKLLEEKDDWSKIQTKDSNETGWISSGYIEKIGTTETSPLSVSQKEVVLIKNTPTGWLRVRNNPIGSEVGKVYPGESYEVIEKTEKWLLIEYEENKTGWISSEFVTQAE